jgi:hypothetical protein
MYLLPQGAIHQCLRKLLVANEKLPRFIRMDNDFHSDMLALPERWLFLPRFTITNHLIKQE